ncbi:MAG: prolyl oligopeptidase family serine peptidase [Pirellulales bacterium]|nr:prolyl oligopeptidase family serine peptidase [Pirellulales bacterium]
MTLIPACLALAMASPGRCEGVNPSRADYTLHKGLSYSSADPNLKLDLFLPRKAPRPLPCVIVIQGGGFKAQDGQRYRHMAEYLANHGFAAALIAYRGLPGHTYRDTIADVKAAVRFVRRRSGDYGIGPDRMGAVGGSAGATLAALLAVTGDDKEFDVKGGDAERSSRIQAAVGIAGVYDFVARFTEERQRSIQPRMETKFKTNGEWIGSPFAPTDKDWLNASPINHVDAQDPPILLLHSKDDRTVPWMQSQDMYERMRKAGIASEIEISERGGHGGPRSAKKSMIAFFKKVLVERDASPNAEKRNLTTIKYALKPFRTFEIVGTEIKGIKMEALPEAIRRHQKQHPGVVYELYAEVKCVPETSDEIISKIRSAGVTLKHYWAPVSDVDLQSVPGKYGYGHVDILEQSTLRKRGHY